MKVCKHMGWIIGQCMHWCDLQLSNYPNCGECERYEPIEVDITYSTEEDKLCNHTNTK